MAQNVLLTGANGFIGAHILSELLANDYSVRAVVRSPEKADQVRKDHASVGSRLDFAVVPDITAEGAFDQAVQADPPLSAVIHTASPLRFGQVKSFLNDMMIPAKQGTEEMLKSVKAFAPSVKRVIFLSSTAAILDPNVGLTGRVFTENDNNPLLWDETANGDNIGQAYRASKKYAEQAGWNFIANEKPNFDFISLNPPYVYGPLAHSVSNIKEVNQSNYILYEQFMKSSKDASFVPAAVHCYIDVRDLARAHLTALTTPAAGNKRFVLSRSQFSSQEIADIFRANFPELDDRCPIGKPGTSSLPTGSYDFDSSRAKEVLGVTFRSMEETFVDLGRQLLEIEKRTL